MSAFTVVVLRPGEFQQVTRDLSSEVAMRTAQDHDVRFPNHLISVIDQSTFDVCWNNQQFFSPKSAPQPMPGSLTR